MNMHAKIVVCHDLSNESRLVQVVVVVVLILWYEYFLFNYRNVGFIFFF